MLPEIQLHTRITDAAHPDGPGLFELAMVRVSARGQERLASATGATQEGALAALRVVLQALGLAPITGDKS